MAKVQSYDLSTAEVKETSFTPYDGPVPKRGLYAGKVTSAEVGQSSKGNDMITVIVELSDAPYKGAPLWQYIVFSDAALWKAREIMEAFGLPLQGNLTKWATMLNGKKCRVRVKNETYNNEMTAKIQSILPPEKAAAKAVSSDEQGDEGDEDELDTGRPAALENDEDEGADEEGLHEETPDEPPF